MPIAHSHSATKDYYLCECNDTVFCPNVIKMTTLEYFFWSQWGFVRYIGCPDIVPDGAKVVYRCQRFKIIAAGKYLRAWEQLREMSAEGSPDLDSLQSRDSVLA